MFKKLIVLIVSISVTSLLHANCVTEVTPEGDVITDCGQTVTIIGTNQQRIDELNAKWEVSNAKTRAYLAERQRVQDKLNLESAKIEVLGRLEMLKASNTTIYNSNRSFSSSTNTNNNTLTQNKV